MADAPDGFAARWSRRKEQARSGVAVDPNPPLAAVDGVSAPQAVAVAMPATAPVDTRPAAAPPDLPTMAEAAMLSRESDFSRFVAGGVDPLVRRAAMKKLFSDPHFNVMDGLDTYIADYGLPDPIPIAMLRQLNQSRFLGLFDDEEKDSAAAATEVVQTCASPEASGAATEEASHDDPDLRLQQDDDAGRPGPGEGPRA